MFPLSSKFFCLASTCEMKEIHYVPGKWRQFIATAIVNLASLLNGLSYGWASPTIPLLQSEQTPVGTEPMTDNQVSWLISVMAIGPLIILPFCGVFSERFGRKMIGLCVAFPYGICWLLIIFSTNFYHVLVAQILSGIGTALTTFFVPLYVTEIVSDSIRGQLGCFFIFGIKVGVVLAYTLGAVLSYRTFATCAFIIPILQFGGLMFLPETPVFLVRKNQIDAAIRSLTWLRGGDRTVVDFELSRLQAFVKTNTENTQTIRIKELLYNRAAIKGLVIALVLVIGQQMCGLNVALTYTATIFSLAETSMDPNLAAIVFGIVQLFGALLSTLTMERAGRRPLLIISCLGMTFCHCLLGVFLVIQNLKYNVSAFSWTPIVALSLFGVFYCLGIGPIPHILAIEVYNPAIASFFNGITLFVLTATAFFVTKFFPSLILSIGLHNCFFFFAFCCVFTLLFTVFFIPETKGKPIESILDELDTSTRKKKRSDDTV